tara:strand:- start:1902 stop:2984 length:1083 start_codon:yes stop_codon:yes gene_type:complete
MSNNELNVVTFKGVQAAQIRTEGKKKIIHMCLACDVNISSNACSCAPMAYQRKWQGARADNRSIINGIKHNANNTLIYQERWGSSREDGYKYIHDLIQKAGLSPKTSTSLTYFNPFRSRKVDGVVTPDFDLTNPMTMRVLMSLSNLRIVHRSQSKVHNIHQVNEVATINRMILNNSSYEQICSRIKEFKVERPYADMPQLESEDDDDDSMLSLQSVDDNEDDDDDTMPSLQSIDDNEDDDDDSMPSLQSVDDESESDNYDDDSLDEEDDILESICNKIWKTHVVKELLRDEVILQNNINRRTFDTNDKRRDNILDCVSNINNLTRHVERSKRQIDHNLNAIDARKNAIIKITSFIDSQTL